MEFSESVWTPYKVELTGTIEKVQKSNQIGTIVRNLAYSERLNSPVTE